MDSNDQLGTRFVFVSQLPAVVVSVGACQSGGFEDRRRLLIFELWDEKVKVWAGEGAGDEANC